MPRLRSPVIGLVPLRFRYSACVSPSRFCNALWSPPAAYGADGSSLVGS